MSIRTLATISLVGALGAMGLRTVWNICQGNNIKKTNYFNEAVRLMRESKDVTELIGEDIKIGHINMSDKKLNGCEDTMAWFTIPVGGNLDTGKLYFVIAKENIDDKSIPVLTKVAFMPSKNPDFVTILKDDPLPSP